MNYRHAFHAGNFADVLKHAVVLFCAQYLTRKDKPFFVLDTHAGTGLYDLNASAARRSPEWRDGVGRLWTSTYPDQAHELLGPYLDAVRAVNPGTELQRYPGSPLLVQSVLREADRHFLCELHKDDALTLSGHMRTAQGARIEARDGYEAMQALLPPDERRGMVLVDPPFEHVDEMYHMAQAAVAAIGRWRTGMFVFWRPLKELDTVEKFDLGLAQWLVEEAELPAEAFLRCDLWVRDPATPGKLSGAGLVVVNPPFTLEKALIGALPWLSETLAQGEGAGWRVEVG